MKIAFFIYHLRDNGSIQQLTHRTANYFSKYNEVYIISLLKSTMTCQHDYKIVDLNAKNNKFSFFMKIFKLAKIIKKNKIDVLVLEHSSFLISYVRKLVKTKIIWVDHASLWWRRRIIKGKMNTLWRDKIIIKNSDAIVSLTKDNKEAYANFFPKYKDKVFVIPNFVCAKLSKSIYSPISRNIVTVGRCDNGKDYYTTIRAFEDASVNNKEWNLFIYAGGPLFEEINQFILNKNLSARVHLIKGETPDNLYKNKSFFIMNSWHEGFSLVILEAMTCGLPIVSYDCHSGPSELIEQGKNGYLVKLGDYNEYVAKINYLINNTEARIKMSKKSLQLSTLFSFDSSMSKWNALFNKILKND